MDETFLMAGFQNISILLVEDSLPVRSLLVSVLNQIGIGRVLREEVRGNGGTLWLEIIKAMRLANAKFLKEREDLSLVSRDFLHSNR